MVPNRRVIVEWSPDNVRVEVPEDMTPDEAAYLAPLLLTAAEQAEVAAEHAMRTMRS